jgi:hypothetical protein
VQQAGSLTLNPSSDQTINLSGGTTSFPLKASETNFTGPFTASSSTGGVVSISSATRIDPNTEQFTIAASGAGTTDVSISDGSSSTSLTVTVVGGLTLSASTLSIAAGGSTPLTAFEPYYTGTITTPNCGTTASFSPTSRNASGGPTSSAAFTVTAGITGTCNGTVTDNHGQSKPLTVTVTGGTFSISPTSSKINAFGNTGKTATFAATETGYGGTFTASSSNTGIATVSSASNAGSPASFTVTAAGSGTATITVSDGTPPDQTYNVTVTGKLSAPDLPFSTSTAQLVVSEPLYSGQVNLDLSKCGAVASGPASATASGGTATFTITGIGPGSCAATVTDDHGQSDPSQITVSRSALSVSPSGTQTIDLTSSTTTFGVTAGETYFTGPFTANSSASGVASVSPSSANGSPASFTVTGLTIGSATITISDGLVNRTIPVTVTGGGLSANNVTISGQNGTLTASEPFYTGPISVDASACTNVATLTTSTPQNGSGGSGSSAAFIFSGVNEGSCTAVVSDNHGSSQNVTVTVVPGTLSAPPVTVDGASLNGILTASEAYNPNAFTAVFTDATCTGIATLASPATGTGGLNSSAGFVITVSGATAADVTCPVSVSDNTTGTVTSNITILTGAHASAARRRRFSPIGLRAPAPTSNAATSKLVPSETNLVMRRGDASATKTISVVEPGYTGAFTISNSRPDIATASLVNSGPGSAQITVTARAGGTALLTVTDANGNVLTIPVAVSTGIRGTGSPIRRPAPDTPGTGGGAAGPVHATN